ncbi:MAG: hypothetical protein K9G11_03375 [Rickettsiaceae bacterium]|nr:hypothetical protein [Rickettsiaceae bacterium]
MQQEPFARAKSAWDFTALPLEDVASFIIELLECLTVIGVCHHERELANQRGDPVINFFLNMYLEELFFLDCHALQARNDVFL